MGTRLQTTEVRMGDSESRLYFGKFSCSWGWGIEKWNRTERESSREILNK